MSDPFENMDNLEGGLDGGVKYTVICGYEFDSEAINDWLNGADNHPPQHLGSYLDYSAAAHIVRTLNEKGEPDMIYTMLPTVIWERTIDPSRFDVKAPE